MNRPLRFQFFPTGTTVQIKNLSDIAATLILPPRWGRLGGVQ